MERELKLEGRVYHAGAAVASATERTIGMAIAAATIEERLDPRGIDLKTVDPAAAGGQA